MEMQKNVYNIIWIDDEIDTLLTDSKLRILDKKRFKLIGVARTFVDFVSLMTSSCDMVDAVITDANFSVDSKDPKNERDLSGLVRVKEKIAEYNIKRNIPFYLYTGRGEFLEEKYVDGELDYFYNNQRYFTKEQFSEMLDQIQKEVECIDSPSFRIRNKYMAELRAAAMIPGNEECLMNALLYESCREWKNTEDYFNPMRNVVESIFSACKRDGIIPDVGELNQISRFLNGDEHEVYVKSQEIMPKPLVRGLWYFLNITQDGSHKKDDLHLKVGEYVRETQNINLFRSVLYIAMDICLWYAKCKEEMKQPGYRRKWERKKCEYEGIVKKKEANIYYCGRFLLEHPKENEYQEGDKIQIVSSIVARKSFKNEDGEDVDRFAYLNNIRKIK